MKINLKNVQGYNDFVNEAKNINEGLIGKISKFVSKAEYAKALSYLKSEFDTTEDEITLAKVKEILVGKLFTSKKMKKTFKEDGKILTSIAEELLKDLKK